MKIKSLITYLVIVLAFGVTTNIFADLKKDGSTAGTRQGKSDALDGKDSDDTPKGTDAKKPAYSSAYKAAYESAYKGAKQGITFARDAKRPEKKEPITVEFQAVIPKGWGREKQETYKKACTEAFREIKRRLAAGKKAGVNAASEDFRASSAKNTTKPADDESRDYKEAFNSAYEETWIELEEEKQDEEEVEQKRKEQEAKDAETARLAAEEEKKRREAEGKVAEAEVLEELRGIPSADEAADEEEGTEAGAAAGLEYAKTMDSKFNLTNTLKTVAGKSTIYKNAFEVAYNQTMEDYVDGGTAGAKQGKEHGAVVGATKDQKPGDGKSGVYRVGFHQGYNQAFDTVQEKATLAEEKKGTDAGIKAAQAKENLQKALKKISGESVYFQDAFKKAYKTEMSKSKAKKPEGEEEKEGLGLGKTFGYEDEAGDTVAEDKGVEKLVTVLGECNKKLGELKGTLEKTTGEEEEEE